jgi:hypothetical protein
VASVNPETKLCMNPIISDWYPAQITKSGHCTQNPDNDCRWGRIAGRVGSNLLGESLGLPNAALSQVNIRKAFGL